jgi:hypothetical protein
MQLLVGLTSQAKLCPQASMHMDTSHQAVSDFQTVPCCAVLCSVRYDVPLVADIHFQPAVAMMVAEAFEKVRADTTVSGLWHRSAIWAPGYCMCGCSAPAVMLLAVGSLGAVLELDNSSQPAEDRSESDYLCSAPAH